LLKRLTKNFIMAGNTSGGVGLADIAKAANCSVAAVSLVLNPDRGRAARISEQTRRRILASAKKLGYRPNRNAEFLKRGYIPEIGLFLPNFGTNLILELIKGCCTSAQEAAFSVSLNFDESEHELAKFLSEATARRNCGLLIYPEHRFQGAEKQLEEYCSSGGKVVFLEPQGPEMLCPMPELPRVFLDDLKGGQLVAEHLLSQNCRNFIIYGDGRTRVTSFIQHIEKHACRFTHFSTATPVENVVKEMMHLVSQLTGRKLSPADYTGSPTAEHVAISMGSSAEVIKEYLQETNSTNRGAINLQLYRPFPSKTISLILPNSCKNLTALDRTKEA
jgi:DNA-binding LacI/PurR family transcriptional regulator